MNLLRGLLLKPTLNLLSWILRHRNGNSVIIGGPLGWEWYSTIDTTHHGALVGPANAHRHSDLADIGSDNHHARLHPTEHQDGGVQEISIAGLSGEPAELTTHKGLPDVHHTKFTITEHDVVERHPLAVLDPTVCSETEADGKITTHKAAASAHLDGLTPLVSDTLQHSNDASKTTTSWPSYVKLKEMKLNAPLAACRIKFDLDGDGGASPATKSEDFAGFAKDDLIQIYGRYSGIGELAYAQIYKNGVAEGTEWSEGGYGPCYVANMRIYYDIVPTKTAPTNQDP